MPADVRVGFVTCVQLGLGCMEEIYAAGGSLRVVLTLRDDVARNKSGRVFVDRFCSERGVDLVKIRHINDADAIAAVTGRALDWLFIVGWSQIAGTALLAAPRRGALGMHPTLLPEGRGRAAIPWAILKGLTETGVTLFQLDSGVDTGPILAQERLPLSADETATTLYERVSHAHRTLIAGVWKRLTEDALHPVPQDESRATVWPARTPADGRITPDMSVDEVDRLVRATTRPYPGAFWDSGSQRLRIWRGARARAGEHPVPGAVRLNFADGAFDALETEAIVLDR